MLPFSFLHFRSIPVQIEHTHSGDTSHCQPPPHNRDSQKKQVPALLSCSKCLFFLPTKGFLGTTKKRGDRIDIQLSFVPVRERVRDKTIGTANQSTPALALSSALEPQDSLVTGLNRLSYERGEERLMLAILKDAVECIERYRAGCGACSRPEHDAALTWVRTHDHTWPLSFDNICSELDLNPERLRSALESLPPRAATRNRASTSLPTASATHRLALK